MKSILCVLAGLCVLAQAAHHKVEVADKHLLFKQKAVYELFWHVDQPTVYHPELHEMARLYKLTDHANSFSDKKAVTELLDLSKHGATLPRGRVFSAMRPEFRNQMVLLFRVLHSAHDFDTFYKAAVWARFHMNELMYVYTLSLAVLHRPDTRHVRLPPMQEVVPHFFFNDEVMQRAHNVVMGDTNSATKKTVDGVDYFVLPANYSDWFLTRDDVPEQKLNYFTEDVGLNSFYFMMSHNYPSFMSSKTFNLPTNTRGEYYFFTHKQLLARYNMERLTNNMGEVRYVSVDRPVETGYYPTMHFRNGLPFPDRHTGSVLPSRMLKYVEVLKNLHTRVSSAVDVGFVLNTNGDRVDLFGEHGVDTLGSVVQGNADTVNSRFYGSLDSLAKKVFGLGFETNLKWHNVPSALEMYTTSMRDPMFFRLCKNLLSYYMRLKENMPRYTQEELTFPGVQVESVNVDKLVTYFDTFDSMLSNGMSVHSHKEAKGTVVKARQQRLNHKPFTVHLVVNSDRNTNAVVRVFLGPKHDVHGHEMELHNNWMNFMQMDQWVVELKTGSNLLDRSSHESVYVMPDEVPSDVFYKKVLASLNGTDTLTYSPQMYGLPERLLLPRGKKEGMPLKLVVVVSPLDESKVTRLDSPVWGEVMHDGRSMGFPLDRPTDPLHFNVPNMQMKDVVVFHREMEELNVPPESP